MLSKDIWFWRSLKYQEPISVIVKFNKKVRRELVHIIFLLTSEIRTYQKDCRLGIFWC